MKYKLTEIVKSGNMCIHIKALGQAKNFDERI